MELLLIRHGRPDPASSGQGPADPGLDTLGVHQAELTAAALASGVYGAVRAVVASTMRRAVESAEPAGRLLGLGVAQDRRLVELDDGATTYGSSLSAFGSRAEAFAAANAGRWFDHTFDPLAFRQRVVAGIEDVVAAHPDDAIVAVFCHGGVISSYLGHVLGVPAIIFCSPGFASVTRVLAGPGRYREVLSLNERGHLRSP